MLLTLLIIVTGALLQVAAGAACVRLLEKLTHEQRQRRTTYIACLLSSVVTIQIPCGVAVAYGSLPISDAAWICLAGGLILLLGLFANSGNLIESSVTPVAIVWFAIFLVPGIRQGRERVIREQEQKRHQVAPDSKTDAMKTPSQIKR